ncbi:hypothetical protein E4U43_007185 [Claviceps pusilla]|uniref:Uncharacterized protein n=1 Tax=Claviceps pusilla TaxID=123648 RepID=A0A9P7NDY1_9HYPO|nr:hypothetical protein E4U43_007185 [Claviceps pusilla]
MGLWLGFRLTGPWQASSITNKQLVVVINTHCTTLGMPPDIQPSTHCDYEFLYIEHTELPINFTTRCTKENGRFPMDDPTRYHEYLYRAIQWGIEYIDVELWLAEEIRRDLWRRRGNSRIIRPRGMLKDVFQRFCPYADIVKLIAIINRRNENFELEYFRSKMRSKYLQAPPLSAVNMGETGQFWRTQNKAFTPITHPLLPIIAGPGQMSTFEIHRALSQLEQLPMRRTYSIVASLSRSAVPQASCYEKCSNELGLPHRFGIIETQPNNLTGMEIWCNQRDFTLCKQNRFFPQLNHGKGPTLTEAARAIGMADTISMYSSMQSSQCRQDWVLPPPRQDWQAFTIVESSRLLVGKNVPYSFTRLASGRSHAY